MLITTLEDSPNFIHKGIAHVQKIFPLIYEGRAKKGSFHFALAFSRNTLIAVGVNDNETMSAKSYRFGQKVGLPEKIMYPYCHAEESLVGRLIAMNKLSSALKIFVVRLNKFGELGESAPCHNCREILNAYGLHKICWSTREGKIKYAET